MTSEITYYTFSLATFFIIVYHVWNLLYYKRRNKNVFGVTFKKGSIEYKRMHKITSYPYIWITIVAVPLSLFNLFLSIKGVFKAYDKNAATGVLIIYTVMVLVIFIGTFMAVRGIYGKSSGKSSKPANRRNDDKDDDWRL